MKIDWVYSGILVLAAIVMLFLMFKSFGILDGIYGIYNLFLESFVIVTILLIILCALLIYGDLYAIVFRKKYAILFLYLFFISIPFWFYLINWANRFVSKITENGGEPSAIGVFIPAIMFYMGALILLLITLFFDSVRVLTK